MEFKTNYPTVPGSPLTPLTDKGWYVWCIPELCSMSEICHHYWVYRTPNYYHGRGVGPCVECNLKMYNLCSAVCDYTLSVQLCVDS